MRSPTTVLVADDSALMRREIKNIIESDPDLRVVACARNGQDAVARVREHNPDVVTLDIDMPVMDGITALQTIMMEAPRPVVMLSSLTPEGARTTFECLELGAVDFVGKPSGTISKDIDRQAAEIVAKVKTAAGARAGKYRRVPRPAARPGVPNTVHRAARRVVAMGVSTGGPKTLMEIVPYLTGDLDAAVVIVQHMPVTFTGPFAARINAASALDVKEACAGDILMSGHGYVARGDKHMIFTRPTPTHGAMVRYVSQPSDAPNMPSVDVMMHSAVDAFGDEVVGVLLTGMGADGADGMVRIRAAGGSTIAEDESTRVVFGMPAQAIARGGADFLLPCDEIAPIITALLGCFV